MEWPTIISILIPLFALFGFMYKELKEWRKETRDETAAMETRFREDVRMQEERYQLQAERSDKLYQLQAERSDKLYQMFIDLLKNQNSRTNP